jgi:hypothetical protein
MLRAPEMLTHRVEDGTIPDPIIPSPWDDETFRNDQAMNEFLDEIRSQDSEHDVEVELVDPTTVPVILYS